MSINLLQAVAIDFRFSVPVEVTFGSAMTAGKAIVLAIEYFPVTDGPIVGVSDDAGNSYSRVFGPLDDGTGFTHTWEVWLATGTHAFAAGNRVIPDYLGNVGINTGWCFEVNTTRGTIVLDRTASHATPPEAGSASTGTTSLTRYANEIVIAFTDPSGGPAIYPGPPWTDDGGGGTGADVCHQIVTSTGNFSATFTADPCTWNSGIVTFGDGFLDPTSGTGTQNDMLGIHRWCSRMWP